MNTLPPLDRAAQLRWCLHFLAKFTALPENQWCAGDYFIPGRGGPDAACAYGHCGLRRRPTPGPPPPDHTGESLALTELFSTHDLSVSCVNDGYALAEMPFDFPDASPRQRILNALRWIKARLERSGSLSTGGEGRGEGVPPTPCTTSPSSPCTG